MKSIFNVPVALAGEGTLIIPIIMISEEYLVCTYQSTLRVSNIVIDEDCF